MKLNNKGMSIIEIVLSFSLIMVMVVGMLTVVVNYRNKVQLSIKKLRMDTFKNTLTQDIQNDILTIGLKEVIVYNPNGSNEDSYGECKTLTDLSSCINLIFKDGTQKAFGVSMVSSDNRDSVENKYLYYDGIKYKLHDTLPDSKPEGRSWLDMQSIVVEDGNILKSDSTVLEDGTNVSFYSIDVPISHIDFSEDFGIHIVAYAESGQNSGKFEGEIDQGNNTPNVKYLRTEIMKNTLIENQPTLTDSSNNTSDASGLYKSTATNSGNPTYYFRGNVENNYVSFAGFTWRVVRINEDGTVRVIMANGINDDTVYSYNSDLIPKGYINIYYTNSDFKTQLEDWYETNIVSNESYSKKVVSGNYFCEQAKVKYSSSWTSGNASMSVYTSYTPDFKCETDGNGKGLVNASIGLITYDEAVFAGGYYNKKNSSYYLYNNKGSWTMSPVGVNSYNEAKVWYLDIDTPGSISMFGILTNCLRPVINLKADSTVTGTGTSTDPYVVQ